MQKQLYKYFSYSDGQYFYCNRLLPIQLIQCYPKTISYGEFAQYATIQDYDAQGNVIGSAFYVDIDNPDLVAAWEDTRKAYSIIKESLEIDPVIYFSGAKGFHLVSWEKIIHVYPEQIVSEICKQLLAGIEYDQRVYTSRRLFRLPGSVHLKTGNRKVEVCESWPIEKVVGATEGMHCTPKPDSEAPKAFTETVKNIIVKKKFNPPELAKVTEQSGLFRRPCVQKLCFYEAKEGTRHNTMLILIRSLITEGLSQQEIFNDIFRNKFYRSNEWRGQVCASVKSLLRKGSVPTSCDTPILRELCTTDCAMKQVIKRL